jgi:hypothetical protein
MVAGQDVVEEWSMMQVEVEAARLMFKFNDGKSVFSEGPSR